MDVSRQKEGYSSGRGDGTFCVAPGRTDVRNTTFRQIKSRPKASLPKRNFSHGIPTPTFTEEQLNQTVKNVNRDLLKLGYQGLPLERRVQHKLYVKICCYLMQKIEGKKKVKPLSNGMQYIERTASNLGIPMISTTHFQTPYAEPQWPHVFPFVERLSTHAIQVAFPPPEPLVVEDATPPPPEQLIAEHVTPPPEPEPEESPPPATGRRKYNLRKTLAREKAEERSKASIMHRASTLLQDISNQTNRADVTTFRDANGAPIPLTKDGLPNLNFNVSKAWVKLEAETCGGVPPNWVRGRNDPKLNNVSKVFYSHFDELYATKTSH